MMDSNDLEGKPEQNADISKVKRNYQTETIQNASRSSPAVLSGIQYTVDENPPWITTILLGFQHYLLLLGSNLATPIIVSRIMCAGNDVGVQAILLGNLLFACGLCTVIQTFIGCRLPIVQCPAFAYIVPMLAMTSFDSWGCPNINVTSSQANNVTFGNETNINITEDQPIWQTRLNMVSGTLMAAAGLEIFVGASGCISILLRFIGPLTVAPTIMMMGLGVIDTGFEMAGKHWGISFGTICLIMILSEVIPPVYVKNPCKRSKEKTEQSEQRIKVVFHKMFSVIISVCFVWLLCYVFTITDVFPERKGNYGYEARTDIRTHVIQQTPWATFPYPGKYGRPTFNSAIFLTMIAGVVTSVIESIGDYYTCARIAGALPPPSSAVNRGILIEGIDCILAVAVGSGFGVTSCSQNIGVISLTKVGSRRVVFTAGVIMMLFGCFSKMSAFIVTIPDPIIGASFIVLFGVLAAVGASNLQYVDLNSSRNMIVFGMGLFCGLAAPGWVKNNEALFTSGDPIGNQVVTALLANNMFIACFVSLVLDNILPGTLEERGIRAWRLSEDEAADENEDTLKSGKLTLRTYDFPFGMKYIRKWNWTKYIPFFPNFKGIENICPCTKSSKYNFGRDIELNIKAKE